MADADLLNKVTISTETGLVDLKSTEADRGNVIKCSNMSTVFLLLPYLNVESYLIETIHVAECLGQLKSRPTDSIQEV